VNGKRENGELVHERNLRLLEEPRLGGKAIRPRGLSRPHALRRSRRMRA
jgi:hypothetical protein